MPVKPIETTFYKDVDADFRADLDQWRETTEEQFYECLETLPPVNWKGGAFQIGEAFTHTATDVIYTGLVQIGQRYFGRTCGYKDFHRLVNELRTELAAQ